MNLRCPFLIFLLTSAISCESFAQRPETSQKAGGLSATAGAVGAELSPEKVLTPIRMRLQADFDRRLNDPEVYSRHVKSSCRDFPEGDLFPYTFPAMAYVNVALREPDQKDNSIRRAKKLVDLAIESVTNRVQPPSGRLDMLRSYGEHATYLGQLNLALGAYSLISKDARYDAMHSNLSDVLYRALVESEGRPLRSFPDYSWPFDTIPVLVSLKLYDAKTSQTRSDALIKQHLTWVRTAATDPRLQLPYSRLDDTTGRGRELPRGCDLSLRLCLLPHVDREYAGELYKHYARNYWLDRGLLAGFAEWPGGMQRFQDMDSGPIVMGIGLGATGLGIGAAIALDDQVRLQRLCGQLASVDLLRPAFVAAQQHARGDIASEPRSLALEDGCFTGFLFGDAVLFYCVTWQAWTREEPAQVNGRPAHAAEPAAGPDSRGESSPPAR